MEEKTIRAIPPGPFAIMLGAISAVIGFIAGLIIAVSFGAITSMLGDSTVTGFGILFGVGAVVIMPIMGFIGGVIEGFIIALIYNFLAPRIGGIKLRFEEGSRTPPPP